jgi:hypothetical protein
MFSAAQGDAAACEVSKILDEYAALPTDPKLKGRHTAIIRTLCKIAVVQAALDWDGIGLVLRGELDAIDILDFPPDMKDPYPKRLKA